MTCIRVYTDVAGFWRQKLHYRQNLNKTNREQGLCSEVPGHSGCKREIDKNKCPAISSFCSGCVGKKKLQAADLTKALVWIKTKKEEKAGYFV